MTKAREVIRDCLTFHLNRLSPGEVEDADLFNTCLRGLNHIADQWNGQKSFLFRKIITASTPITGTSGTLGTDWASLVPGDEIDGAMVQYSAGQDTHLDRLTMAQYLEIPIKTTAAFPRFFAHDGADKVYFYPACTGQVVKLLTKQVVSDFLDLDTDYSMPKGYKSALSACLAELLAPTLNPALLQVIKVSAKAARDRVGAQAIDPAIIDSGTNRGNILTGWR
jgi:hypothetical protein